MDGPWKGIFKKKPILWKVLAKIYFFKNTSLWKFLGNIFFKKSTVFKKIKKINN